VEAPRLAEPRGHGGQCAIGLGGVAACAQGLANLVCQRGGAGPPTTPSGRAAVVYCVAAGGGAATVAVGTGGDIAAGTAAQAFNARAAKTTDQRPIPRILPAPARRPRANCAGDAAYDDGRFVRAPVTTLPPAPAV
jgi:hypothetical protein